MLFQFPRFFPRQWYSYRRALIPSQSLHLELLPEPIRNAAFCGQEIVRMDVQIPIRCGNFNQVLGPKLVSNYHLVTTEDTSPDETNNR